MITKSRSIVFVLIALLSSCGALGTPALSNIEVTAPESIGATASLNLLINYRTGASCPIPSLKIDSRTASELKLTLTVQASNKSVACVPENYVNYTDAGTPSRMGPFNIYVNGELKSSVTVTSP